MKKCLLLLMLILTLGLRSVSAAEETEDVALPIAVEDALPPAEPGTALPSEASEPALPAEPVEQEAVEEIEQIPEKIEQKPTFPVEKSWDHEMTALRARMHDLERRISFMEQQGRFQDEKIRNLDRSIDDLRRRH